MAQSKSNPLKCLVSGTAPSSIIADFGLTILRLFTGLSMAFAHGLNKVQGPSEKFIADVEQMGFPMPVVFAWAAAVSEFGGGLLLAAGLFTRISALVLCGTMLVAGLMMHGVVSGDGFAGMEMALLYAAISFAFLCTGAGRFSIDGLLR